mmetsp:Transcript_30660/g.59944  ORF Transcript_30660/g.59944 Transcript_30660/m.59944 type:complete len:222 (+) Transcript_30660:205-870(+)
MLSSCAAALPSTSSTIRASAGARRASAAGTCRSRDLSCASVAATKCRILWDSLPRCEFWPTPKFFDAPAAALPPPRRPSAERSCRGGLAAFRWVACLAEEKAEAARFWADTLRISSARVSSVAWAWSCALPLLKRVERRRASEGSSPEGIEALRCDISSSALCRKAERGRDDEKGGDDKTLLGDEEDHKPDVTRTPTHASPHSRTSPLIFTALSSADWRRI